MTCQWLKELEDSMDPNVSLNQLQDHCFALYQENKLIIVHAIFHHYYELKATDFEIQYHRQYPRLPFIRKITTISNPLVIIAVANAKMDRDATKLPQSSKYIYELLTKDYVNYKVIPSSHHLPNIFWSYENIIDFLIERAKYAGDQSFGGIILFIKSFGRKDFIVTADQKRMYENHVQNVIIENIQKADIPKVFIFETYSTKTDMTQRDVNNDHVTAIQNSQCPLAVINDVYIDDQPLVENVLPLMHQSIKSQRRITICDMLGLDPQQHDGQLNDFLSEKTETFH